MGPSRPHLDSEVERLLTELCVQLGFCLTAGDRRHLCESPPAGVDNFTDAVMAAEGMTWPYDKMLRRQVRELVEMHMSHWERTT
jgi:hypothetical protein